MKNHEPSYDLFISYRHAVEKDRRAVLFFAGQLQQHGVRVFVDKKSIRPFDSITRTIQQDLSRCKAMVIYLTKEYMASRACVWELTAAFIASQKLGAPSDRIFVVNPEDTTEQLRKLPIELQDAKYALSAATALKEIPRRIHLLEGVFQNIGPLTAPKCLERTLTGSDRFVGRLSEMWQIHSNLNASLCTLVTAGHTGPDIAQVNGIGGIGKTLLAEEYALRFGSAYPGGIFWLEASGSFNPNNPNIEAFKAACTNQYLKILNRYGEQPPAGTPFEYIRAAVARRIENINGRCLWIVDDIPFGLSNHLSIVKNWFAPHALACTLVTTRSRQYNAIGKELPLDVLDKATALDLLKRHYIDLSDQKDAALDLIEQLDGHAMALDIAGAVIANDNSSIEAYLKELDQDMKNLIDVSPEFIGALPSGHERSIVATYKHGLLKLGEQSRNYLRLAANLSPAPIPNVMAEKVFQLTDWWDEMISREVTRKAVLECSKLSLAKPTGDTQQVHALTSAVVHHLGWPSDDKGATIRTAAIETLSDTVRPDLIYAEVVKILPELEHARHLTSVIITEAAELKLLYRLADFDHACGYHKLANENWQRLFELNREQKGPDHPDTLTSMGNLALTLGAIGDHAGAKKLEEQVLEQMTRILGPDHLDTLTSMNNLALTLRALGDHAGAKKLEEQVLERMTRILGPDHPDTLTSMGNLASTLGAMGDHAGAKKLEEQVLEQRTRILGPDHPDTLTSMGNLALTLRTMGDHAGAKKLEEQVLERMTRILGPDHPDTLTFMGNLASTLEAIGDHAGAKKLQEQMIEQRTRILGPDHPDTLTSMNNLALTLRSMGDHAGAKKLQEQVLEQMTRILGPDHPATLTSMGNLALALRAMGDHAGAKKLQEQVLEQRTQILGPDHPDTLTSMNNLSLTLGTMGDHTGAKKLQEQVLEQRTRILGPGHPDTLTFMGNLALTLRAMGDHVSAKKLQEQVLEQRTQILGPDHPATLTSMNNLASTLGAMGDHAGAIKLQEQVLEQRIRILGPDHPATLTSMGNLASTLGAMGDHTGAKKLQEQVLEQMTRILGTDHPATLTSMNNLASTLRAVGDHAGAKKLQEQVLEQMTQILGTDHPATTLSAWNLFSSLLELEQSEQAQQILSENLLWLLKENANLHDANQQQIREMLKSILREKNFAEGNV